MRKFRTDQSELLIAPKWAYPYKKSTWWRSNHIGRKDIAVPRASQHHKKQDTHTRNDSWKWVSRKGSRDAPPLRLRALLRPWLQGTAGELRRTGPGDPIPELPWKPSPSLITVEGELSSELPIVTMNLPRDLGGESSSRARQDRSMDGRRLKAACRAPVDLPAVGSSASHEPSRPHVWNEPAGFWASDGRRRVGPL